MSIDARTKAAQLAGSKAKSVNHKPMLVVSRIVFSSYYGLKALPTDMSSEGTQVFKLLSRCFQIARDVREAPLHEAIWGLTHGGYPHSFIMRGFMQMHQAGYIALTDSNCHVLDLSTVGDTSTVWYMLTDKWLALLATKEAPGIYPEVSFDDVKLT
jgi:hypothetical protein